MKRMLIAGAGSYVGGCVREYLETFPNDYTVETLETKGLRPDVAQFYGFDVVFYVAGIAHQRESKRNAYLYYEVNRDLTISIAETAKLSGVGQIIVMSTMAVYGLVERNILKSTKSHPTTHYGKSKLAADHAIWRMRDERYRVAILRLPMIYGRRCKGNYQKLRKLVMVTHFFPRVNNQRSMLYDGNLCEFVKKIIDRREQELFFPQNSSYVNTSEMVRKIRDVHGKSTVLVSMNDIGRVPLTTIRKAFGSLTYEQVDTINKYSFENSVRNTEKCKN